MKHPISPDTSGLYEKIWNFVREQLSVRYPFFRRLLWNFSFQESSETSSAGTDGNVIYFCPDFLIKTFQDDPDTLEKLFLHMLYHCLFLHLILEIPSDAQRWDQACDLAVYRLIHHEKKNIVRLYFIRRILSCRKPVQWMIISSGNRLTVRSFSNR